MKPAVVQFDKIRKTATVPNINPATALDKPFVTVEARPHQVKGRKLWAELHSKQNPTPEWFESWLSRVPSFGCSCQQNFRGYVKDNPPDFDDFYRWGVDAHNWVNLKLNKPIWTGGG